jgi:probable O-glycosylation ligase (exosortase A-associated)
LNYLRQQSRHRLVRLGLIVTIALCVVAIFGTQSRGTFVAFAALCLLFVVKARSKLVAILLISTVGLGALYFMPERWQERMKTITTADEDSSFQGRVDAWIIAYEIAKARPLVGAGLRVPYLQDAIDPFLSEPRKARAAHSIFFEFLGSLGFVGLGILLAILYFTWRNMRWIARHARGDPRLGWAYDLAQNGQLSFLAFLVGGSAVSLDFWEGFWLLVAITHRLRWLVEQQLAATDPGVGPAKPSLAHIPADRVSLRR